MTYFSISEKFEWIGHIKSMPRRKGSSETHNNFSRPVVAKRIVSLNRNHFCEVRTHFYNSANTHDRFCDRRVVQYEVQSSKKVGILVCIARCDRF